MHCWTGQARNVGRLPPRATALSNRTLLHVLTLSQAQARVVDRFRRGDLNLLVATNIGSEGMDFKQCAAVVAFEPPPDLTSYIQVGMEWGVLPSDNYL